MILTVLVLSVLEFWKRNIRETDNQTEGGLVANIRLEEQRMDVRILLKCKTSCPFARHKNIRKRGGAVSLILKVSFI